MTIRHDHAAVYCRDVLDGTLSAPYVDVGGDLMAPRYVKLQCAEFLRMWDGEHPDYMVDEAKLVKVCRLLRLLRMAKGPNAGKTLYGSLVGFQWLVVTALTCCVRRDDPKKRRYESALLEICRKNGKALSLDTEIPTPAGWKRMEDVHEGDFVFGPDGKPAAVLYESPIFNKRMYAVEFEDGEIIKASADHIWTVKSRSSVAAMKRVPKTKRNKSTARYREGGWYDATTEELARHYYRDRRDGKGRDYMYRVPMTQPVEYPERDLPLDPYLLGVWLGDGSSNNGHITVSYEDAEETMRNLEGCGYSLTFREKKDRAPAIIVDLKKHGTRATPESFLGKIRALGVYKNKHIPEEYMTASVEQRLALLQGLMDTDGTVSKSGECEFTQMDRAIVEQVVELASSLGIKTKMKCRDVKCCGVPEGTAYRAVFFTSKSRPCFRMRRKFDRLKDALAPRMDAKSIVRIEEIEQEPSKCIMVDNADHLYLAGRSYTATHNTFLVAVLFLVLFFTEPKFSRFFSVAPDGALAKELKEAIEPLITVNEEAFDGCFKVTRDYILNKPRSTRYVPLNYSTNRMDGREPNVFIADEIGALPTNYALEAMRSGQLLVKNKLGFAISTKYPTVDNPLEDEAAYAKKVLDGIIEDDALFALLYEPDEPDRWADDDAVLAQGNPLALELEPVWLELLKKREKAIERESLRENFLTKHCNVIYQGVGTESYIPADQIAAAMTQPVDFAGRELYVGVDLAMTNDNCAVAVACEVDGCICADVTAFVPADRVAEKSAFEKLDYIARINAGECVACGDLTVDYSVIEDFVSSIEDRYGGTVASVGYDRYNALSSAQKWESEGLTTVEVRQHSSVLHPPTKLLAEKAASGKLRLRENKLLEINFANARCTYDTNLNRYVNKKKSNGKVDMVMALIDAVYLLQQDVIFGDDFVCQF